MRSFEFRVWRSRRRGWCGGFLVSRRYRLIACGCDIWLLAIGPWESKLFSVSVVLSFRRVVGGDELPLGDLHLESNSAYP